MKKIFTVTGILTFLFLTSNLVSAACAPLGYAESQVWGQTYVLKNSPNQDYPVYLSFHANDELTASYGSALDGHPGGEFHYKGDCHGHITVTFTSYVGDSNEPEKLFHLRARDRKYLQLESSGDKETVFEVVLGEHEE